MKQNYKTKSLQKTKSNMTPLYHHIVNKFISNQKSKTPLL